MCNPYAKSHPQTSNIATLPSVSSANDEIKNGWSDDDFATADEDSSSDATDPMQDEHVNEIPRFTAPTATPKNLPNIATLTTLGRT